MSDVIIKLYKRSIYFNSVYVHNNCILGHKVNKFPNHQKLMNRSALIQHKTRAFFKGNSNQQVADYVTISEYTGKNFF